jgi:tRNA(Ile)-lysidine synthase TilS/MesJ
LKAGSYLGTDEKTEKSITKKYRKDIWRKFISAVTEYRLIEEGDRIAVCISGGKDSMLMAKCIQLLQRYSKFEFGVEYMTMDPGYSEQNRQAIIENAQALRVPIKMFEARIFDYVATLDQYPCYMCARMRRGYLYKQALEKGCNKIALGHHMNDVTETVLMSMFYNGEFRTMMPKLKSRNWPGIELIRPMYKIREEDIIAWKRYNGLNFLQCACRLTESCILGDDGISSKRKEMKALIKRLEQANPHVVQNIFNSVHDISLETVIGYHNKLKKTSFTEAYMENLEATAADEQENED